MKDDLYYFWEETGQYIFWVVLIVALAIGASLGAAYLLTDKGCDNYIAMNPDYQFRFDFWAGGCFIKYGDLWISTENIQLLNGEISISD